MEDLVHGSSWFGFIFSFLFLFFSSTLELGQKTLPFFFFNGSRIVHDIISNTATVVCLALPQLPGGGWEGDREASPGTHSHFWDWFLRVGVVCQLKTCSSGAREDGRAGWRQGCL